ncbi:MAG: hypothetical protein ABSA49_07765 [Rhizomicrobium sp.]|jgi:uncharacterized membrane protein
MTARIAAILALGAVSMGAAAQAAPVAGAFNQGGNILIADQFNNRVIEIDPKGQIVWQWGLGPKDVSANSIVGVNDAERVGQNTLMAGTGAPPKSEPLCKKGCPDNRVMLVGPSGNIIWQYGQFGVTGSGPNELNAPVQATWSPTNTVYITDQSNQRVIEVDRSKNIIWQYGATGTAGAGYDELNSPNSAELLDNGDVLIADEGNNRVIEVDKATLNIVATFTIGGTSSAPAFASRLPNGQTLITDGGNNRIVTVNAKDQIVFEYYTDTQSGSNPNPQPSRAVRTIDGKIVISDQFNNRVIVIDKDKNIKVQYGTLNVPGYGATSTQQGLNGPYDAKVIGDFTGLTQP